MQDDELFAELERRLREGVDPGVAYVDGAFVLHRRPDDGSAVDPPLHLHVTPRQLGEICRGMADDAAEAFGGPPLPSALNLFLVHLDETVAVDLDRAPDRRHVLAEPYLALVGDPAVPDDPLPEPPPLPAAVPGAAWYAYPSGSGEPFPSTRGGRSGSGAPADRPEVADVGRLARRALRSVVRIARAEEPATLGRILRDHLGELAGELPVVAEQWPGYEHINVQAGLDAWLEERPHRLVGVVGFQHHPFGLAELLAQGHEGFGPRPGAVARVNLAAGPDGEVRACVRCAVYLVDDGGSATALLLRGAEPESGMPGVVLQIAGTDPERAAATAADVRRLAGERNVYRGHVVSFGREVFGHGEALLQFHPRPRVDLDRLVLPAVTLATIRRQVVAVARHAARLTAAGQHLKRGLLLYGPPGAGKTHTVRHLIGDLEGTTVVQLTGDALHLVAEACSVARALQPSMLVVEDVDLIAEDRGMHPGQNPLLFQLLNEMDGLAEDADVVFVLTTNRADLLEPALAARPGRVDQAVELTLPDRTGRRQLFDLYAGGLDVDTSGLDGVLDRTDGVTASFLKELLRRAAVVAAERSPGDGGVHVTAQDLDEALDELHATRNAMTRVLLGSPGRDG